MDMKLYLILIGLVLSTLVRGQSIQNVRNKYYAAVNDSKASLSFYKSLKGRDLSNPLMLAYFGSAQALKARFAWNPYNKLSYLSEGLKTLKTAVSKSPDDLEIRFLRFTLVHYLPAFLGYGEILIDDRKKIVQLVSKKHFGSVDKILLKNLINFMESSKRCSEQEMAILEKAVDG
jgi:hypothetical protein